MKLRIVLAIIVCKLLRLLSRLLRGRGHRCWCGCRLRNSCGLCGCLRYADFCSAIFAEFSTGL